MNTQWLNGYKKATVIVNSLLSLMLFFFIYTNSVAGQINNSDLEIIKNLSITETNGEYLTWELLADSAIINKKENLIRLTKLILFYHLSSGENIELTGDKGIADLSHKQISIYGNITAKSEHGIDLKTEALTWDAMGKTLTTKNPFEIMQSDIIFSGTGLHADLALKKINFLKGVKTVIY